MSQIVAVLGSRLPLRLWFFGRPDGSPVAAIWCGPDGAESVPDGVIKWATDLAEAAMGAADSEMVMVGDLPNHSLLRSLATASEFLIGTLVAIRIRDVEGDEVGLLIGVDPEPRQAEEAVFSGVVTPIISMIQSVWLMEQERAAARIHARTVLEGSQRDALTGVLNRQGWDTEFEREASLCREMGQAATVVLIDMDNLKFVNDRFGHARGDQHLQALAELITAVARSGDVVARLGGDEFALLAPGTAPGTAENLRQRVEGELVRAGLEASVGVAECPPGGDLHESWRRADADMYAVKRLRRRDAPSAPGRTAPAVESMADSLVAAVTVPAQILCRVAERMMHPRPSDALRSRPRR